MDVDIERLKIDESLWPIEATHYTPLTKQFLYINSRGEWYEDLHGFLPTGPSHPSEPETLITRPQKPAVERAQKKFGTLINPKGHDMVYGYDHVGRKIEVVSHLVDEGAYVVRFDWGLGCIDCGMIDFQTEEQRQRDELSLLCDMYIRGDEYGRNLADAIISAGWKKDA